MKDIDTFESICSQLGEPLAVWEPQTHPLRQRGLHPFSANPDPYKVAVWKISDEGEGGIVIGCTWHEGPPHQWHINAGHRQAVAHLMELLKAANAEKESLQAENDRLRSKIASVGEPPDLTLEWCDELWRKAPQEVRWSIGASLKWCIEQDRARLAPPAESEASP
jgi:hypothetical protein